MAFVVVRSVILYLVVAVSLRIMGKRQIGELQPSELVITLLFSELASMPMQSPDLPLISGLIPIFVLAAIEIAVSTITLKNVKLRYALYGKPIILAYKGAFDQKAMEKARVTVDDLTEAMRTSGIIKIEDIEYAILETNGNMSIIPKSKTDIESGMSKIIVIDGRLIKENAVKYKFSKDRLSKIMKVAKIDSYKEIFLLSVDDNGKTYLIKKEKED